MAAKPSLQGEASSQRQNPDGSRSVKALLRRTAEPGEVRLALAILANAVRCLRESQDAWNFPPRLFRWEAEQWIESRDRKPHFSFENICSILNLDPNDIRDRIGLWRARLRRPSTGMTGVHSTCDTREESSQSSSQY